MVCCKANFLLRTITSYLTPVSRARERGERERERERDQCEWMKKKTPAKQKKTKNSRAGGADRIS